MIIIVTWLRVFKFCPPPFTLVVLPHDINIWIMFYEYQLVQIRFAVRFFHVCRTENNVKIVICLIDIWWIGDLNFFWTIGLPFVVLPNCLFEDVMAMFLCKIILYYAGLSTILPIRWMSLVLVESTLIIKLPSFHPEEWQHG